MRTLKKKNHLVRIYVEGKRGSGKTHVAKLLKDALQKQGWEEMPFSGLKDTHDSDNLFLVDTVDMDFDNKRFVKIMDPEPLFGTSLQTWPSRILKGLARWCWEPAVRVSRMDRLCLTVVVICTILLWGVSYVAGLPG